MYSVDFSNPEMQLQVPVEEGGGLLARWTLPPSHASGLLRACVSKLHYRLLLFGSYTIFS